MLRRRRVGRAEELLRGRGLSLAEIALASGFADQAQLTKAFRRITGFTRAVTGGCCDRRRSFLTTRSN